MSLPEPLAVDSDILMYLLEDAYPARQSHLKSERIGQGHSIVVSTLALAEVLVGRHRIDGADEVAQFLDAILGMDGVEVALDSIGTASVAASIRAATGLKLPDAVHLATAMTAGAAAFLTNDAELARKGEAVPIPILRLDDLIADREAGGR